MWHSGLKMTSGCREIGGVASNVYGPLKGFWFYLAESISTSGRNYLHLKEHEMNHLHYHSHGKIILSGTHTAFFLFLPWITHIDKWQFFLSSEVMLCEGQHFPAKIANAHFETRRLSKRETYIITTIMICDISFRKWHSSPVHWHWMRVRRF